MGGRVARSDVGCGECGRPQSGFGVVEPDRSRSGACDRVDQSTTVRCVCEGVPPRAPIVAPISWRRGPQNA